MGQKIAFGLGMLANQMFPAALGIFMVVLVQRTVAGWQQCSNLGAIPGGWAWSLMALRMAVVRKHFCFGAIWRGERTRRLPPIPPWCVGRVNRIPRCINECGSDEHKQMCSLNLGERVRSHVVAHLVAKLGC